MKDIEEIVKINNSTICVVYYNGQKNIKPVNKIESRAKALELCEYYTRLELNKQTAFDNLSSFIPKENYNRLRNYEIEDYLDYLTGIIGNRINEDCPFNGFSWFDE